MPEYHTLDEDCDECGIPLVLVESHHSGNPYDRRVVAFSAAFQ